MKNFVPRITITVAMLIDYLCQLKNKYNLIIIQISKFIHKSQVYSMQTTGESILLIYTNADNIITINMSTPTDSSIFDKFDNQLLQLCKARTVWSHAVITPVWVC